MENWAHILGINFYKVGRAAARRHRGDAVLAGYRTWRGEERARA